MSKKKKTRKEKQHSDLRKAKTSSNPPASSPHFTYEYTLSESKSSPAYHPVTTTHDYGYVYKDVQKTLLITAVLLGINVVIYYLLQHHILSLPFMGW